MESDVRTYSRGQRPKIFKNESLGALSSRKTITRLGNIVVASNLSWPRHPALSLDVLHDRFYKRSLVDDAILHSDKLFIPLIESLSNDVPAARLKCFLVQVKDFDNFISLTHAAAESLVFAKSMSTTLLAHFAGSAPNTKGPGNGTFCPGNKLLRRQEDMG